jgi:hypothetical protein
VGGYPDRFSATAARVLPPSGVGVMIDVPRDIDREMSN